MPLHGPGTRAQYTSREDRAVACRSVADWAEQAGAIGILRQRFFRLRLRQPRPLAGASLADSLPSGGRLYQPWSAELCPLFRGPSTWLDVDGLARQGLCDPRRGLTA